jgi:hypothetical protein
MRLAESDERNTRPPNRLLAADAGSCDAGAIDENFDATVLDRDSVRQGIDVIGWN